MSTLTARRDSFHHGHPLAAPGKPQGCTARPSEPQGQIASESADRNVLRGFILSGRAKDRQGLGVTPDNERATGLSLSDVLAQRLPKRLDRQDLHSYMLPSLLTKYKPKTLRYTLLLTIPTPNLSPTDPPDDTASSVVDA